MFNQYALGPAKLPCFHGRSLQVGWCSTRSRGSRDSNDGIKSAFALVLLRPRSPRLTKHRSVPLERHKDSNPQTSIMSG